LKEKGVVTEEGKKRKWSTQDEDQQD
jgi:hypothetical protein